MKFGPLHVTDALGAMVAHAVHANKVVMKRRHCPARGYPGASRCRRIGDCRGEARPRRRGLKRGCAIDRRSCGGSQTTIERAFIGRGSCRLAIVADERVSHDMTILAQALRELSRRCDLIVVFGASAIKYRRDVIPAALEAAGGEIEHFGMPVDPGNLLLLGAMGKVTAIGAPGCARSPKENGFDWVLHRILAGVPVTRSDIRHLEVGGLLMEIVSRPQPRSRATANLTLKRPAALLPGQRHGAAL